MKILFVGSNPSVKNIDPRIPFTGTRSDRILSYWIEALSLSYKDCLFINLTEKVTKSQNKLKISDIDLKIVQEKISLCNPDATIALGMFVSRILKKIKKDHFQLPHPSPKNRKLNDPAYEREQLELCRNFLQKHISILVSEKPSV